MTKIEISVQYKDHDTIVLTNANGDTYTSKRQELMEFFHGVKPNVSGDAINRIENLMERWHLARDNNDETLQGINDVLVDIGLLSWFNK